MKKLFTLLVAIMTVNMVYGQARVADVSMSVTSPANNWTFTAGTSQTISGVLTNNGPDKLKAGDTLVVLLTLNGSLINGTQTGIILQNDIDANGTFNINYPPLNFNFPSDMDGVPFCIGAGVQNRSADSLKDNNSTNNLGCITCNTRTATSAIGEGFKLLASEVNVYPSPATNNVNVAFNLTENNDVTVRIFDITGREVATLVNNYPAGDNSVIVPVNQLQNGTYIYNIEIGSAATQGKIIVAH